MLLNTPIGVLPGAFSGPGLLVSYPNDYIHYGMGVLIKYYGWQVAGKSFTALRVSELQGNKKPSCQP